MSATDGVVRLSELDVLTTEVSPFPFTARKEAAPMLPLGEEPLLPLERPAGPEELRNDAIARSIFKEV